MSIARATIFFTPWKRLHRLALLLALGNAVPLFAQSPDFANVQYAKVDDISLKLDIYLPRVVTPPFPTVIWIHGGGWQQGSKAEAQNKFLTASGYAFVSIDYRLTHQATFPAQLYDCKAAIRWVRAHAATYGFDPKRIGVWGESAGGHLAALLGVTMHLDSLEGNVGGNMEYSSAVRAVCSYYGPMDLVAVCAALPHEHCAATSPEGKLIGGNIASNAEKARAASPIHYVSEKAPPFLFAHGTVDHLVPFQQSVVMDSLLRAAGATSSLLTLDGAGHGGSTFTSESVRAVVVKFFERYLKESASLPDTAGISSQSTYVLFQNYPNPFNSGTTIRFALPQRATVTLKLYDAYGRSLFTLLQAELAPGEYAVPFEDEHLPSGNYFYELRAGNFMQRRKALLLR